MTRLWLDDLRDPPEGWVHACTAAEAIDLLAAGGALEISLDHDLGEPAAGTGYDVALWIEERAAAGELGQLAWTTHSGNPAGRARIEAAMRSAERCWFANAGGGTPESRTRGRSR